MESERTLSYLYIPTTPRHVLKSVDCEQLQPDCELIAMVRSV